MLAIDKPRAEGLRAFVAEQRLGEDDEDAIGVVPAGDADLLRHGVDKAEDIADRKIVAGRLRALIASAPDAIDLQQEKPGDDAGDAKFRVPFNLHLKTRSAVARTS